MADEGHLYELEAVEPARFRARGLDSAHRVAHRVGEAVRATLEADPEVLAVEDLMYLREKVQHCDSTPRCRASLHYLGCPRHG